MKKCETLGGRSFFYYSIEEEILRIKFGNMPNFISIPRVMIETVKERVDFVHYSKKSSLYNKPVWSDCPNNKTCPYIAALIINNQIK